MTWENYENHMRSALAMARRGLGGVAPNPAVGCVIVKNDRVIARGCTANGGRPHAESVALEQAGEQAKGADVYVTLEPCSHHGKTPPCAQALIEAQVGRVIVSCVDSDPRVNGQGIAMLRDAGIKVIKGVLEAEARALNAGFFSVIERGRPWVTLKVATSADHKIAARPGVRTQISGEMAHRYLHDLRSRYDAVLVGVGTVLADDPRLNARIRNYDHNILRVVLDGESRTLAEARVREGGVLIITKQSDETPDPYDLPAVLKHLATQGVTRLLVEGGAKIHASFLEAGLCDEFQWIKSPVEIGSDGLDAIYGHDIANLAHDFSLKKQKTVPLGQDMLEIYRASA